MRNQDIEYVEIGGAYVYEEPLSMRTTALLLGAPTTLVVGTVIVWLTMTASSNKFQR